MFPQLSSFTDVGLLLLRLMVGLIIGTSGCRHLKDPEGRSKSIGMSKGFTVFLGVAELAGALGVVFWGFDATGRSRADFDHAGRDPEESICVEDRDLGQAWHGWLALRPDAGGHESGDSIYEWRKLCAVEVRNVAH
jgi:hypothetical protein